MICNIELQWSAAASTAQQKAAMTGRLLQVLQITVKLIYVIRYTIRQTKQKQNPCWVRYAVLMSSLCVSTAVHTSKATRCVSPV